MMPMRINQRPENSTNLNVLHFIFNVKIPFLVKDINMPQVTVCNSTLLPPICHFMHQPQAKLCAHLIAIYLYLLLLQDTH
jgi:hypothetical protein